MEIENIKMEIVKGYKIWLSQTLYYWGHAPVYLYSVQTPDGQVYKDMDISEIYTMIYGPDYPEILAKELF